MATPLDPEAPLIERMLERTTNAPLRMGNRLTLLLNGDATYQDWLAAIAGAQHWIHLENYIFKADEIGTRFAEALAERARAGVSVRVLYDWFGSHDVPSSFWADLRTHGADVRAINPPRLTEPLAVVQRDHRKALAVDGAYASVGGVGIADQWLQRAPATGLPYRDSCVSVVGPAVADIERAFADVWDRNGSALPLQERPQAVAMAPAGGKAARVVIQEPGKMRISRVLEVLAAGVERRVWIADAYFLAGDDLREALIAAAREGVDVRLLLPSTNDLPLVGAMSRVSYRPLLEAGVRIWEYRGPMMHAKTTVADGWWSRIGSTNLNVTGFLTNWEIDLIVEDPEFGARMEHVFEDDLVNSKEIVLEAGRLSRQPRGQDPRRLARSQVTVTMASLSGAVIQGAALDFFRLHEEKIAALAGVGSLAAAAGGVMFPRLLAFPLAALLGLVGVTGIGRALRVFRGRNQARRARRTSH